MIARHGPWLACSFLSPRRFSCPDGPVAVGESGRRRTTGAFGTNLRSACRLRPDRRRDAGDVEVRLWIARLQLRMGRTEEAEAGFSAVLREHPADVDASVGLGSALTRRDAWSEALAVLLEAAPRGGENSDPFGRSSVRTASAGTTVVPSATTGGRSRSLRAIRTWSRGTKPRCARNGSSIVVEGFGEAGVSDARAIPVTASIRVLPRLEVEGLAAASSVTCRSSTPPSPPHPRCWRGIQASAGGSPRATRYSRSSFHATGESSGDNSVLARETFRGWRCVDMTVAYAQLRRRSTGAARRVCRRRCRESEIPARGPHHELRHVPEDEVRRDQEQKGNERFAEQGHHRVSGR